MDIVLTEKDVVRFWARVDRRGPDECWLWLAAKDPCGYGEIGINRRVERAHRSPTHCRRTPNQRS